MSKSLKNLYTLDDINHGCRGGVDGAAPGYSAAELRFEMLAGHYRQKMNFTWDGLRAARINLERIAAFAHRLETLAGRTMGDYTATLEWAKSGVSNAFAEAWAALLDDLNTPSALGRLNTAMKPLEKRASAGDVSADEASEWVDGLAVLVHAFGWELPAIAEETAADVPAEVQGLAEKRTAARAAKDWAASDVMRDAIAALGWQVKDGRMGMN